MLDTLPATADERHAVTDALLYLDGVYVAFDGFKAINGLSLVVRAREMRAIIGPNGAGKTTMMDIITGKTRPDSGVVLFDGGKVDLTRLDEAAIANLGIGRKFQKPTVFESHTVYDNIMLALAGPRDPLSAIRGARNAMPRDRVMAVLDIVRLTASEKRLAGALSHGQKQWLEIGMLLAQDPELLLVDEPVAGMTDAETEVTAELLKRIAQNHSVIVVEHDMAFVRALGVRVTCLHEGAVLAEGSIDAVSSNPRVIEVYLGR
jgi:urea transport system ATP-binding protein